MSRALTVLAAWALSCTQVDAVVGAIAGPGTVYGCDAADGTHVELCYEDDAAGELSDLTDTACHTLRADERFGPWVANTLRVGCWYTCPPPERGCNAHQGCFCP